VPVEFLDGTSTVVRLTRAVKPGNAIARRASEVRAGQIVLPRGTPLGPAQLAVAATVGAARVKVYARPRVAVLSTGDELVAIGATPRAGQIRNSNSLMLSAMLYAQGADVTDLGSCADEPDALRVALADALAEFDVLVLSGGVSMGTHDFVPGLLADLGVTLRITKVKMKPGKPFVFGTHDATEGGGFVFGLPGNPISSFVCATLFASRLFTRLAGGQPAAAGVVTKTLAGPLPVNGPREFYQPAAVDGDTVYPLNWKGSSDVFTLATANALIVRPENDPAVPAGGVVTVIGM
jgi:molybdopterin molybdotransferase